MRHCFFAGWSSPVARQAHNLKVVGSNPTPATSLLAVLFQQHRQLNPGGRWLLASWFGGGSAAIALPACGPIGDRQDGRPIPVESMADVRIIPLTSDRRHSTASARSAFQHFVVQCAGPALVADGKGSIAGWRTGGIPRGGSAPIRWYSKARKAGPCPTKDLFSVGRLDRHRLVELENRSLVS
jgi:hypothetical protein